MDAVLKEHGKKEFPAVDKKMSIARIWTQDGCLHVNTGLFCRSWAPVKTGIQTVGLRHVASGKEWDCNTGSDQADWRFQSLGGLTELRRLTVTESTDEEFSSPHLQVDIAIRIIDSNADLIYRIWCYPGASGMRTQLLVRGTAAAVDLSCPPVIAVKQGQWERFHGAEHPPGLFGIKVAALTLSGLVSGNEYILAVRVYPNKDGGSQSFKLQTVDGETHAICSDERLVSFCEKPPGTETVSFRIPAAIFSGGVCDLFISQSISEIFAGIVDATLFSTVGVAPESAPAAECLPDGFRCVSYLGGSVKLTESAECSDVIENLRCELQNCSTMFSGYYSDTQRLNTAETEILKETPFVPIFKEGLENRWASLVVVQDQNQCGLIVVKESHKCVNTPKGGARTGGFRVESSGIEVSGAGWTPEQLMQDQWHACWATWLIGYQGGVDDFTLALKKFDRLRYPVHPDREIYIMANTWGGGRQQEAATEENVLREMQVQAELGIDVQQIDDGWEGPDYIHWTPAASTWPGGWKNIKKVAEKLGLKLGLWFASNLRAQDILRNREEGGFQYFKLDFGNFKTMDQVDRMRKLLRRICCETNHTCRVNWDVTEASPRSGYFWGREFGNVYLENRTVKHPAHCIYQPWLVLRDAWQVAQYLNLNQFQLTVQNGERISLDKSDASRHSPTYLLAQTLMGVPLFFQETKFYSEAAKAELKPLIALYKKHRREIFDGFVFPVGDKPDNASWSGFQTVLNEGLNGYLLLFRQLENKESRKSVSLKFMSGRIVEIHDLVAEKIWCQQSEQSSGGFDFEIPSAPGFIFCKYRCIS